ncbi:MAG TPA: cytochrome c [Opitutaceae bacterium]|nr:cytochrome c [Opitutaceae bacterium]
MKFRATLLLAATALGLAATAGAATPPENWEQHCAKCHGADGSGNTRLGTLLKIRDLTKTEVQASFTDAAARTAIKDGVKDSAGRFTMNPYGGKLAKEDRDSLVAFVRALKK